MRDYTLLVVDVDYSLRNVIHLVFKLGYKSWVKPPLQKNEYPIFFNIFFQKALTLIRLRWSFL